MIATFTANGLATIGAGSLIGIEILDAIILAGTLGVVKVSEDLARAFLDDGNLSIEEINDAFSKIDRSKKWFAVYVQVYVLHALSKAETNVHGYHSREWFFCTNM